MTSHPAALLAVVPAVPLVAAGSGGRPLVVDYLGQIALAVVLIVAVTWVSRVVWRERVLRMAVREQPENAEYLRRTVRSFRLMPAPRVPHDPHDRSHHVVVPPYGDGRPGEEFWAPSPGQFLGAPVGPDGSRQDAVVVVGPRMHMVVVCLGRVGARSGDGVVLPAAERVEVARASVRPPDVLSGPVDQVPTAAGLGWRATVVFGGGRMLTDTHLDRDGWGFVVGALSESGHATAVEAVDGILSTWRWLPDGEPVPR